ncbi:MAG: hypothetical protein NTZ95_08580 [Candidatus Omnitrophica bacterium]|nr:hypothetical protein [Candidatus Omnitrophota bacterium]
MQLQPGVNTINKINKIPENINKKTPGLFIWKPARFLKKKTIAIYRKIVVYFFVLRFKPILKTRQFKCNRDAKTEVHTLTCHSHLPMYITSIKSLLRFCDEIAVVTHDDGSLSSTDIKLLEKHIKGVKVIGRRDADVMAAEHLKQFPNCSKYRDAVLISLQLFDFMLYSKTGKIIALDSDTLFLRKPKRLIEWILSDNKEIIHIYEKYPYRQMEFLSKFNYDQPANFCMGFGCYYRDIVDLKTVATVLDKVDNYDWWLAQNIFAVLIKGRSGEYPAHYFEKSEYQDFNTIKDGAVFRHYWFNVMFTRPSNGLWDIYLKDARKVICEISKS